MSDAVTPALSVLARLMRDGGSRVGVGELLASHRALGAVDPASREDARLALRVTLCSGREDVARFESAFRAVFGDGALPPARDTALEELAAVAREAPPRAGVTDGRGDSPPGERASPKPVAAAWSEVELIRHRDFSELSESERVAALKLIRHLARRGAQRRSRRLRATRRRTGQVDLRRTARAALRTGGEPVHRGYLARKTRPRSLVLILDVSGSMAPYGRMLLTYLQAAVSARRRVEAFAFGTRLTRITHELRGRDPDAALQRASDAVNDLAAGTRIGAALGELNRVHGRRIGRGADVIVLSDGWDRGDPELLAAEMSRLRRSAHRLIWLNPLAGHPGFAPLAQGMRAAVPHTDTLLAGNSLGSLEKLARTLEEA